MPNLEPRIGRTVGPTCHPDGGYQLTSITTLCLRVLPFLELGLLSFLVYHFFACPMEQAQLTPCHSTPVFCFPFLLGPAAYL